MASVESGDSRVSTAPGSITGSSMATTLGLSQGMAVQELGWDEDTDEQVRSAILDTIGDDFVYEDVYKRQPR